MVRDELEELLHCLGSERRVFRYYQDRFAPLLLGYAVGPGAPVRHVRQSAFAPLLDRPAMKRTLARFPDGIIRAEMLEAEAPNRSTSYSLTLGEWGSDDTSSYSLYYQTSRPGKNLVLQINFDRGHDMRFSRIFNFNALEPRSFNWAAHPVACDGHTTLAWTRIDLDLRTGEALIEEVQNDWIRCVYRQYRYLSALMESLESRNEPGKLADRMPEYRALHSYVNTVLAPHVPIWDEAALMATIAFLRDDVGIRTIYYHTFESGCRIKEMRRAFPPRTIYSALPRRFCFRVTERVPEFLMQDRRWRKRNAAILDSLRFHLLEL